MDRTDSNAVEYDPLVLQRQVEEALRDGELFEPDERRTVSMLYLTDRDGLRDAINDETFDRILDDPPANEEEARDAIMEAFDEVFGG